MIDLEKRMLHKQRVPTKSNYRKHRLFESVLDINEQKQVKIVRTNHNIRPETNP